jgi:hypothetical protein
MYLLCIGSIDILTVSVEYVPDTAEDMQKYDIVYPAITDADEKLSIGAFCS